MNNKNEAVCPVGEGVIPNSDLNKEEWAIGPGSVTWKILKDPAVFFVGELRTSLLLSLHPPFATAAVEHDSFMEDPVGRFKRVVIFTYLAAYGSYEDAQRVAKFVHKNHHRIKGVEPTTQKHYQAHSEYELALTSLIQTSSFLDAYEYLYGQLSTESRDQFFQEQQSLASILGTNPDHLPSSYHEAQSYLTGARKHFAAGLHAREVLAPFDNKAYPRGTMMGDLPILTRKAALWVIRAVSDMSLSLMSNEDRALIAINRRPKLFSKAAVSLSYKLLSTFMTSTTGRKIFDSFLGDKASKRYRDGLAMDSAPGARLRESAFQVPDAKARMYPIDELIKNWPGSPFEYKLGDNPAQKDTQIQSAKTSKSQRRKSTQAAPGAIKSTLKVS